MSIATKSCVFLGLTFAISWLALVPRLWGYSITLAPLLFLLGPVLSAVICAMIFEPGRRLEALGLQFRPNVWWLVALLTPLALGVIAAAANLAIAGQDLLVADNWRAALAALGDIPQARYIPGAWALLPFCILLALFSEEPAWRGYLYHLWRDLGLWRSSVAVGIVWSVWHWPMLLLGVTGTHVGVPELAEFTVATLVLAAYATLLRDRSGSAIAVAIAHGGWNSVSHLGASLNIVASIAILGLLPMAIKQRQVAVDKADICG
ncbi:abortive infection protein [Novosphingobium sediminis]|uniref:Abortive infection protein n=1 Tax=Novosphingobium sediminis TaxID=707214 RepID=A0A512ALH6_9SPHN|nr:CPBP family intramembrane glutamic endopeptidase [Novosphingobium sediminis]GEO00569.1 abortive infection protein [Novosphingobium sediminis]